MDQVRDLYIRIGRFRSMLIGRERERKKERKKERERERYDVYYCSGEKN